MNGATIPFVLGELGITKRMVDVVAERAAYDGIGVEKIDRLTK